MVKRKIMKEEVTLSNRKSAFAELKDWCVMSCGPDRKDKGDFLEVTEWSNGEGYDVYIHDVSGDKQFHFTWGQFDAIKKCIKTINK
jgi:hypothetical protein